MYYYFYGDIDTPEQLAFLQNPCGERQRCIEPMFSTFAISFDDEEAALVFALQYPGDIATQIIVTPERERELQLARDRRAWNNTPLREKTKILFRKFITHITYRRNKTDGKL